MSGEGAYYCWYCKRYVTAREVEGRLVCDICGIHLYPGTVK